MCVGGEGGRRGGGGGGGLGGVFKGTGSICSRHTFIRAGHREPQP